MIFFAFAVAFVCKLSLASEAPKIPLSAIDQYDVTTFQERQESFYFTRLRLSGDTGTILLNPIRRHRAVPTQDEASVRFVHDASNQLKIEIFSFREGYFDHPLNATTLQAYLAHKRDTSPPEKAFEILEEPVETTGPAKFRFLGKRALTLRYAVTTESGRIVRGENWTSKEGIIYVIGIEGPPQTFDAYFEDIRVAFNLSSLSR